MLSKSKNLIGSLTWFRYSCEGVLDPLKESTAVIKSVEETTTKHATVSVLFYVLYCVSSLLT
jgi:hypothetical protein